MKCPSCGSTDIKTTVEQDRFQYGEGTHAAELVADVDVHRCQNCGLEYLDRGAERARHEAVCAHLGILNPRDIRAMRKSLGLTRSELAAATGLGEATIARWERGAVIQNKANDLVLRLLLEPGGYKSLQEAAERQRRRPVRVTVRARFSYVANLPAARRAQAGFLLRKAS